MTSSDAPRPPKLLTAGRDDRVLLQPVEAEEFGARCRSGTLPRSYASRWLLHDQATQVFSVRDI